VAQRELCSVHPLNTFPNLEAAANLANSADHGTTVVAEGDACVLDKVLPCFEACGFTVQKIDAEAKPLYHAASVIVCNYLTTLMHSGLRTAGLAGLNSDQYWQAIQPLVNTTLANLSRPQSLSGPIARGDLETVKNHLNALENRAPELGELYRALGKHTAHLAADQEQIDTATCLELEQLFKP